MPLDKRNEMMYHRFSRESKAFALGIDGEVQPRRLEAFGLGGFFLPSKQALLHTLRN